MALSPDFAHSPTSDLLSPCRRLVVFNSEVFKKYILQLKKFCREEVQRMTNPGMKDHSKLQTLGKYFKKLNNDSVQESVVGVVCL